MEYLAISVAVLLVSMSLKLKHKIELFKSVKKGLLLAILLLVIGGLWDSYAILRGYWSFKEEFFIGIDIGIMPLEEYLFMLIIPFLVLVLYKTVAEKQIQQTPSPYHVHCLRWRRIISYLRQICFRFNRRFFLESLI